MHRSGALFGKRLGKKFLERSNGHLLIKNCLFRVNMDRRDNEVRYNASKDDKVSRGANVCAVSGVADDALGLIQFHEK